MLCALLFCFAAAPPLAGPEPMPRIIPAVMAKNPGDYGYFYRKGWYWSRLPNRRTKVWYGTSGLQFCDDPDCGQCNTNVYPPEVAPDFPVIPIRRGGK